MTAVLLALTLASASAQAESAPIPVEGVPQDIALVRPVLQALYPTLSEEVREVLDRGLVFVLRRDPGSVELAAQGIEGWSAEDDPEYRYPDRRLYPQGTIKVNFTPFVLDTARLLRRIEDPRAQKPLWVHLGRVLTHEVLHARQYMTKPIPNQEACPGGDCEEFRLKMAILKIQYETEAFEKDFEYEKRHGLEPEALLGYLNAHPEVLEGLPPGFLPMLLRKKLAPREKTLKPYQVSFYWRGYDPALLSRRYSLRLEQARSAVSLGKEVRCPEEACGALKDLNFQYEAFEKGFSQYQEEFLRLWPDLARILPGLKARHEQSQKLLQELKD